MKRNTRVVSCALLGLLIAGCSVEARLQEQGSEVGLLEVDLQHMGEDGATYHLRDATLEITGGIELALDVGEEVFLRHSLPPGEYDLELLDGWHIERQAGEATEPIEAQLVSPNPAPFTIAEGNVTNVTLVFEMGGLAGDTVKTGDLTVDMEVRTSTDGGYVDPSDEECIGGLVINEVDYDQPGTDEAEFVELFNGSDCAASTEGLHLELINGADGQTTVYATADLSEAGSLVPAHGYLVVGTDPVLAAIPEQALGMLLSRAIQNGSPDGVRLTQADRVLDSMSYGGIMDGITEADAAPADGGEGSVARCQDGIDTDDNAADFGVASVATPGSPNQCTDADG